MSEALEGFTKLTRTVTSKWMVKNEGRLNFSISIQRGYCWDINRKSLLIHSLIAGYPVPSFYAQDTNDDSLAMLDGKQRMSTIIDYQKGLFALSDMTPFVGDEDISGLRFNELPEAFQEEIKDYSFTVFTFKNMTESQRDQLFLRLNNGLQLSRFQLTRVAASSHVMDFISEMSDYAIFKDINISDAARNSFTDEEIILQILSVMTNGCTQGFSGKELLAFAEELRLNGIDENIQQRIRDVADYLHEAIPSKDTFMKKVHVPVVFNLGAYAREQGIIPAQFGGFLQEFFKNPSAEYSAAARSKSASKDNLKVRVDEIQKAYNRDIYNASEYKAVEPKAKGKGKKATPILETIDYTNPESLEGFVD